MRAWPTALSASALLAAVAAAFLSVTVAASTLDAGWTAGGGLLPLAALVACLVGVFAGLAGPAAELPWVVALALESGVGAGVLLTGLDVHALPFGLGAPAAASDQQLGLALLYGLTWATSGLLGWAVASGRVNPLLGLGPAVALQAVNSLNHPDGQQTYAVVSVAASLLVLLATHHARLAALLRHELTAAPRTRRRYWAAGAAIAATVLGAAAALPPLSSVDQTTGGPWLAWSNLVHATGAGLGAGGAAGAGGAIGLSTAAGLFGGLTEGPDQVVFTYTTGGTGTGPYYFRAIDLVQAESGEWVPLPPGRALGLGAGQAIAYGEAYAAESPAAVTVDYVHPIVSPAGLVVYPGRLLSSDRTAYTRQSTAASGQLLTLDSVQSRVVGGRVVEQVAFPNPSESQLQAAGTDYPAWVQPYGGAFTAPGYRSAAVLGRIAALARQVTRGTANPYDAASAVESYLRDTFTYTLSPPDPPAGTDALDHFLFSSRRGYCQYFAVAMGDMLRSLGIPTRLVNGFGPGTEDLSTGTWSVHTNDAHTWVEAYFPGYGWIPFEPTPDGTYFPITRAPDATASGATAPAPDTAAAPPAAVPAPGVIAQGTAWIAARRAEIPWALLLAVLGGLALLLVTTLAARPRTAAAAWRRLRWVSALAGVGQAAGETPLEFGDRLGRWQPAAAAELRLLAERFSAAAYAPPERAAGQAAEVVGAWRSVRSALVRRALRR